MTSDPCSEPSGNSDDQAARKDFRALRATGDRSGFSYGIGMGFVVSRDALARALIRMGLRPNHLTVAGLFFSCAAGVCFAFGAGHGSPGVDSILDLPRSRWPVIAGALVFLAAALDMLDGSLAKLGNMQSRFGAFLDSTLDRISDMALFAGVVWYFVSVGNLTYSTLAVMGLCNGVLISYTKALAEELIPDCSVGYWLRGERIAAVLIASLASHVPALLWQQAILPAFTWLRRMVYASSAIRAEDQSRPGPNRGPYHGALRYVALWRHPRGSLPYDLVTGLNIAFLLFGPRLWPALYGANDPLRMLLNP